MADKNKPNIVGEHLGSVKDIIKGAKEAIELLERGAYGAIGTIEVLKEKLKHIEKNPDLGAIARGEELNKKNKGREMD